HLHIHQDQIRLQSLGPVVALRAVEGDADPVSLAADELYQQAQLVHAVVDDEQVRRAFRRLRGGVAHLVFANARVSMRSKSRVSSACCTTLKKGAQPGWAPACRSSQSSMPLNWPSRAYFARSTRNSTGGMCRASKSASAPPSRLGTLMISSIRTVSFVRNPT